MEFITKTNSIQLPTVLTDEEGDWLPILSITATSYAQRLLTVFVNEFPPSPEPSEGSSAASASYLLGDPRSCASSLGRVAVYKDKLGVLFARVIEMAPQQKAADLVVELQQLEKEFPEADFIVHDEYTTEVGLYGFVPCLRTTPGRFTDVFSSKGEGGRARLLLDKLNKLEGRRVDPMVDMLVQFGRANIAGESSICFCS